MKKLISKIRHWLCNYHKKRYEKLHAKIIGATRYYLRNNISKEELNKLKAAFYSGETHANVSSIDVSSFYPCVMKYGVYSDTDSFKNFCAWKEKYKNEHRNTDSVKNR